MDNNKIINLAGRIVVSTFIVGTLVPLAIKAGCGIYNLVQKAKYNRHIKKGLEDGSVVEIDGVYYDVVIEDQVEED